MKAERLASSSEGVSRPHFLATCGGKKNQKEKHQPTAERKLALLKMRDIAASALRDALWKDNEACEKCIAVPCRVQVQDALMAGLEKTQPELARILSLGVLVHILASAKNCRDLLHNEKARRRRHLKSFEVI